QLQEVATCARRQDLALRLFVPDRCEQSACVPRHAEQAVFHGPPRNRDGFDLRSGRFVDRRPAARWSIDPDGPLTNLDHLTARMWIDVEDRELFTFAAEGGLG